MTEFIETIRKHPKTQREIVNALIKRTKSKHIIRKVIIKTRTMLSICTKILYFLFYNQIKNSDIYLNVDIIHYTSRFINEFYKLNKTWYEPVY